ncbi:MULTISPECIES: hypothetical protein [Streptomyces]|uniref:hypothetical protein n=1 Tax=Streptomyces lycopersici TaxID=2974589 RepID=UPI0021CE3740|nr:hypothetical protein [Streptomyces sp. NEAU-383]
MVALHNLVGVTAALRPGGRLVTTLARMNVIVTADKVSSARHGSCTPTVHGRALRRRGSTRPPFTKAARVACGRCSNASGTG